jgi:hypothetical protein
VDGKVDPRRNKFNVNFNQRSDLKTSSRSIEGLGSCSSIKYVLSPHSSGTYSMGLLPSNHYFVNKTPNFPFLGRVLKKATWFFIHLH